jgi:hypothetical protein
MGTLHGVGAGVMFVSFTVFALFLFPQTTPGPGPRSWGEHVGDWLRLFVFWKQNPRGLDGGKLVRNHIYLGCGLVMLGCLVATPLAGFAGVSILWFETVAWECFAVCWLVKGRVDQTPGAAARAIRRALPYPIARSASSESAHFASPRDPLLRANESGIVPCAEARSRPQRSRWCRRAVQ